MATPELMFASTPLDGPRFFSTAPKIDPDIHLNYLWLVLTSDALPRAGQKPFPVFKDSIAFNAHLTEWRTWETSVNRAAFLPFQLYARPRHAVYT